MPYSNPKDDNSAPLLLAATEGYLEVVKYLLPFSDVDLVYDKLTKNKDEVVSYKIKSSIEVINDYLFRKKLNDILSEEIDNSSERKKRKF